MQRRDGSSVERGAGASSLDTEGGRLWSVRVHDCQPLSTHRRGRTPRVLPPTWHSQSGRLRPHLLKPWLTLLASSTPLPAPMSAVSTTSSLQHTRLPLDRAARRRTPRLLALLPPLAVSRVRLRSRFLLFRQLQHPDRCNDYRPVRPAARSAAPRGLRRPGPAVRPAAATAAPVRRVARTRTRLPAAGPWSGRRWSGRRARLGRQHPQAPPVHRAGPEDSGAQSPLESGRRDVTRAHPGLIAHPQAFYPDPRSLEPLAHRIVQSGALPNIAAQWRLPMEIAVDLCKLALFDVILLVRCVSLSSLSEPPLMRAC